MLIIFLSFEHVLQKEKRSEEKETGSNCDGDSSSDSIFCSKVGSTTVNPKCCCSVCKRYGARWCFSCKKLICNRCYPTHKVNLYSR